MRVSRALLLALATVAALALPTVASASQVTKQADTNDGSCAPGNCSLRDAINYGPVNDVVNVPTGTYHLDMSLGQLIINHALTVVHGFYAFHDRFGDGPVVNPVPVSLQRRRALAHRSPLEPVPVELSAAALRSIDTPEALAAAELELG